MIDVGTFAEWISDRSRTPKRGSVEWREAHRGRISASDAVAFLARPGSKRYASLVNRLVLDFEGIENHTTEHPDPWIEKHEEDLIAARSAYVRASGKDVDDPGYVRDFRYSWLGSSPHAVTGDRLLHFRIRKTLERFKEGSATLERHERARLHVAMFVCELPRASVVDFWDGGTIVDDRLEAHRVDFDPNYFTGDVLPRIVRVWADVDSIRRDRLEPAPGARSESP